MKCSFFLNLFFVTLFISCKSQTTKTLEEFKRIDSSLQTTNAVIASQTLYQRIKLKKDKYPELALHADSIIIAKEKAFIFIDSLKEELKRKDTSGEKTDVGNKLILNSKKYAELKDRLLSVYSSCITTLDTAKQITADDIFNIALEIKKDKKWELKYFDKTPTIAAITVLNKFKNDCSNLVMFTLKDIEGKIKD